jgi:hypothetical protein
MIVKAVIAAEEIATVAMINVIGSRNFDVLSVFEVIDDLPKAFSSSRNSSCVNPVTINSLSAIVSLLKEIESIWT